MNKLTQVRLPDGQLECIDGMVKQGLYANRSDAIRDAVRQLMIKQILQVGIIPNTGDSVEEVRKIRKSMRGMTSEEVNSIVSRIKNRNT